MKLDDAAMQAVVAKAILDAMTTEARAELIESAVKSMLETRQRDRYGSEGKTQLQIIFEEGVREVGRELAREHCGTPEVRERIRSLIADATDKALGLAHGDGTAREAMVEKIADGIRKGLTGDRY